ncbi:NADP-dependent 3-hydroxy acid dehydrogenase [Golovinomyces cichoracearum]|uniref:NADP-dependent 3-hydroxy acid dehydrogenase n=1 Tax=Golovinomyces cichoracearum TaxID=62708 RepID=A0A420J869_9PEZI|nr:NADP-dependent 3-hydroxy acid dehydrogenase [Golovinomyces cichoracearum]
MFSAMAKRLSGKTIIITGASSGIGRSTAIEFSRTAEKDLRLILVARRSNQLEELKEKIERETSAAGTVVKVLCVPLDISQRDEIKKFGEELKAQSEWRNVDVLVNNALVARHLYLASSRESLTNVRGLVKGVAKSPNISQEDIDIMFNTNVTGLIAMTQEILPILLAKGTGDIINVGSIAGREPYPGGSIYCATKAAVRSYTDALRKELISTRIRVIEIDPGQVETEFSIVRFYGDKSKADAVYTGCEPLTPDDIAEVIVFASGRRENVVLADTLIFPNHQAAAGLMHRKS